METNERIRKLEVVLKAVQMLVDFVRSEVDAVGAVVINPAGELAAVKAKNAELKRKVAALEKTAPAARTDPTPPPVPGAPGAPGRMKRAVSPLPRYVERRGDKFGCNVQHKDLKIRKGGFETAQAAHDYAVERMKENGAGAGVTDQMKGARSPLPRFVYRQRDKFRAACNRKDAKFDKTGFKTAGAASEWAEAEFNRKSAGGATTSPACSSHANRGRSDRPRTPEEMKIAIDEQREQTGNVARKWWECGGCSHELGGLDDKLPDTCPKCGSVKVVKMEGMAGADPVEVKS